MIKRIIIALTAAVMALAFCACGDNGKGSSSLTSEGGGLDAAGDYYIDLTELGMKLTIYLRINADGSFMFSNTTAFEVDKSSGTVEKSKDEYIMVYTSVGGKEKSISDNLNSKFIRAENGDLDFTVCERIYYGSAGATTTSEENKDARLIAKPLTSDYKAPETDSSFKAGSYIGDNGMAASFFEDGSYLLFSYGEGGFLCEAGEYGVSTTQLALTPHSGDRISCTVVSESELSLSVPSAAGERETLTFKKTDAAAEALMTFSGEGKTAGTDESFAVDMVLYTDGSALINAGGYEESGLIVPDTAAGSFKLYPDNPNDKARGLKQVENVPAGEMTFDENGAAVLKDLRVRTSDSLNRDKATVTEER